ncbi:NYN domain-containing protein, partial [Escherichia coli]
IGINYYTARISGRIDSDAPRRQQIYFNALKSIDNLSIHYGTFSVNESRMFLVQPLDFKHHLKNPNQKIKFANVLKTEEKGSDVNLGCHLVRDGFQGKYEKAVIITNDTDLAEPMRVVKSELSLYIELLSPVNKPARTLSAICDKVTLISDQSIADSQFEDVIVVGEKTVTKPAQW